MDVKPGNVETLIEKDIFIKNPKSTTALLFQMLQALDYLANENIIHRDVKPANILYSPDSLDGSYLFQLADFGLANLAPRAWTDAGTQEYKAPEIDANPPQPQTPKLDVWSLFVTLAVAMDEASIRSKPMYNTGFRIKAIHEAANSGDFRALRNMVAVDPSQRASAGDMLDGLFHGAGRVTPRKVVVRAGTEKAAPGPSTEVVNQCSTCKGKTPSRDRVEKAYRERAEPTTRKHLMVLAEKVGPANPKSGRGFVEGASTQGLWLEAPVHTHASPVGSPMGGHAPQANRLLPSQ